MNKTLNSKNITTQEISPPSRSSSIDEKNVLAVQDEEALELFQMIGALATLGVNRSMKNDFFPEVILKNKQNGDVILSEFVRTEAPSLLDMRTLEAQGELGQEKEYFSIESGINFRANDLLATDISYDDNRSDDHRAAYQQTVLPTIETVCPLHFHLFSTTGNDILNGGSCDDIVTILAAGGGTDVINVGAGNDTITGYSVFYTTISAGSGNDTITVDDFVSSTINLEEGNDTITIGDDVYASTVNAGDGNDIISIGRDLNHYAAILAGDGNDSVTIGRNIQDFSDIYTGNGNDIISIGGNMQSFSTLVSGDGNDTIFVGGTTEMFSNINAGNGDDTISVTGAVSGDILGGAGNDTVILNGVGIKQNIYGGGDSDTFLFTAIGNLAEIEDFSIAQNDILDISALLTGYDPMTDLLSDFVRFNDSGADTVLQIDADGGADSFLDIVTLVGNAGLDATALEASGSLDIA